MLRSCSCNIYADDVVIYISEQNIGVIRAKLQADLEEISKWFKRNKIKVNTEKNYSMLLKRNSQTIQDLNISLDGNKIKQEQNIRYLGIEIDENLTWNIHVKKLSNGMCIWMMWPI